MERREDSASLYNPVQVRSPEIVRILFSGHEGLASSILWAQTIFQFSDQVLSGKPQSGMERNLVSVVLLDTLWRYPYEFAAMSLEGPGGKPHPIGVRLLAKGVRRFPDDARMAILLSQLILRAPWLDSNVRRDSAIKILTPLAKGEIDAPEFARTLAVTLVAKFDGDLSALQQLLYLWGSESDPLVRLTFSKKLPELLRNATGFEGDSLAVACEGINRIMEGREADAARAVSEIVGKMTEQPGRTRSFKVFASIAASLD